MRRTRLYFLGAVLEAARYFLLVRYAAELLGARSDTARAFLHLAAPHLLVAGGLAALSHDPRRFDVLRGFLSAAKALSVATAAGLLPALLLGSANDAGASSGPSTALVFLVIAAWDLALAIALAAAKPFETAPDFPQASETELVALDDSGAPKGRA